MTVQTKTGQVVRGNDFFPRPNIIESLQNQIDKNSHILISAPRRIGKTSIMHYLHDNAKSNYLIKYLLTQSVYNENEYYKRIYKKVIEILKGVRILWKQTTELIKSHKIASITVEGITIEENEMNYYNELLNILKTIDLGSKKLIIMVDEFSETLENIIKDEGEREAVHFLESNRDFRQLPELHGKVQFIYAGSIGLENIVGKLNKMNTINDLYPLNIPPFTKTESKQLIAKLINNSDLIIDSGQQDYIIERIEWLIPFFIQIIIDEIDKIDWPPDQNQKRKVTNEIVDQSIKNSLENRSYFEHWFSRLRIAFKSNSYKFVISLLDRASEIEYIHSNEIYDLAVKNNIEGNYKEILNSLKYDGYINNAQNLKEYRFNSPFLKLWWYGKVAN